MGKGGGPFAGRAGRLLRPVRRRFISVLYSKAVEPSGCDRQVVKWLLPVVQPFATGVWIFSKQPRKGSVEK